MKQCNGVWICLWHFLNTVMLGISRRGNQVYIEWSKAYLIIVCIRKNIIIPIVCFSSLVGSRGLTGGLRTTNHQEPEE